MILKPIAKPVRIRIKSGGEEHSSLESLKQNFCLEDIKPLLDGRLSRWLQRQGEKEQQLAEELKRFDVQRLDQAEGAFAFLQLFFAQELEAAHLRSLQEVACHWVKDPVYQRNGGYLVKAFVKSDMKWTDLSFAKAVYKQQLLPNQDWSAIFKSFLDREDPELHFIYGKLLYEGKDCAKDVTTGRLYIEKAVDLGYEDAKKYLKTLEKQTKVEDKRKADEKSSKIRREVMEIIQREMAVSFVNDQTPIKYINLQHLKDELYGRFKTALWERELSRYTTVGKLVDFIMTKIPVTTPKDITKLKKDLEQWKNRCRYAPYVSDADFDNLNRLLQTKYDLELSFNGPNRPKRNVAQVIDYVLSQYSE